MINYIESNMDPSSKQDYMKFICEFYKETLENFYQKIGKTTYDAQEESKDSV